MNKQQMIDRIYEVIADKTLSFGCKYADKFHWDNSDSLQYNTIINIGDKFDGINLIYYIPDYFKSHIGSIRQDFLLNERREYQKTNKNEGELRYKIIGHPVMIGDVLDWIDKQHDNKTVIEIGYNQTLRMWKGKRKPIEDQSEQTIKFIYDLISDIK